MKRVSVFLLGFLIVSLVLPLYQIPQVKAQESNASFGNPSLPNWLNVTVSEFSENVIVDNGDGFVWEFPKDKDKYNQIYENDTLIVKDEQWLLITEDLKEDSHPISRLEWEQPQPYHVVVRDYYEDVKNNNNFTVTYSFYGGFHPKITFNASIGLAQNYTVDWRCWLYKDNAIDEAEKHWVKFWNGNETGVVFNYEDVYATFGDITESDVTGWFKGKRFDQNFNVGFLNISFLLDPTFGYETKGGTELGTMVDYVYGSKFTCTEVGTATSLTAYCKTIDDSRKSKFAIYKASDQSLVGYTEEYTSPGGGEDTWITLDIISGGTLTAQDYYLTIWQGHTSMYFYYAAGADSAYDSENYISANPPPNPWDQTDWGDKKWSIFCNYTTDGAQEKSFSLTATTTPTANQYEYKEKLFTQTQTPTPTTTLIWGIEKLFFGTEITNTIDTLTLLQERQFGLSTSVTVTSTFQYGKETVSFLLEQFETININTATQFLKEMIFFYDANTQTIVTMNLAIDKGFKTFVIFEVMQPIATYAITIEESLTLPGVYGLAALAFILAVVALAIVVSRKD